MLGLYPGSRDGFVANFWEGLTRRLYGGSERVLKYLARYARRVAISNHRLRTLENSRVSFDWKDYEKCVTPRAMVSLDSIQEGGTQSNPVRQTGRLNLTQYQSLKFKNPSG